MDFAMQALCPLEDIYDETDSRDLQTSSTSWPPGFSNITGDRRSLSDASDPSHMPSSANSIISEAVSPSAGSVLPIDEVQDSAAKPKRRRENRYKNAPPAVISRRRAQNRASQRAYRERKDQRIRDLEELLEEANRKEETLSQAYHSLQAEYERLVAESQAKGVVMDDANGLFGGAATEFFASTSAGGADGGGGGLGEFGFLDGLQNSDMLTGLYLQHDRSTYPPII